jgi:hypothetical protein
MTQPIAPWASTPNYPAGGGSWSGLPTKIAPAATYLTPKDPTGLSAQNLNWIWNQRDALAGQVATGIWLTAAANWNDPVTDVGSPSLPGAVPLCATWDQYFQRWIVGGTINGGAMFLSFSPDGGKSWAQLPGVVLPMATGFLFSVASSPATGNLAALSVSGGGVTSVTVWTAGVGTAVSTVQPALAGADMGVCTYWNNAFWYVGSSGLLSPSWTGFSASSATGAGVWTNESGTLPAGWTASGSNAVQGYISAQSSTTLAVAMCGATLGASSSRLMMQTTSAGWADVTPALLGGSSLQIRGLAYSVNDALWGLLAQDNAGNSYLYTSPDLATWSISATFTGFWSGGLAVIGSVWSALVYNAAAGEAGNQIVYSGNVALAGAASTWTFAAYAESITGAGTTLAANSYGTLLGNAGAPGGAIVNGLNGAPDTVGSQMLRVEMLRVSGGGTVASSHVAGFTAPAPIAASLPAAVGASSLFIRFAVNFSASTFQSLTPIPSGYQVVGYTIDTRTPWSGGTTFELGQGASTALVFGTGTVDSSLGTIGPVGSRNLDVDWGGSSAPVLLTIGGGPTAGAGFVIVEYVLPAG